MRKIFKIFTGTLLILSYNLFANDFSQLSEIQKEEALEVFSELIENEVIKVNKKDGSIKIDRPLIERLKDEGILIDDKSKGSTECGGWPPNK